MTESGHTEDTPAQQACWYCGANATATCQCGRAYCQEHGYDGYCLLCALGMGLYEKSTEPEPVSGLIMLSLRAASGDPYIVLPATLQRARPLPLATVENMVSALTRMLSVGDDNVKRRAAGVLAATTNTWPTMNPSPLAGHQHGISLLAADQVRHWILHTLKSSRVAKQEATALAILEKLQTADFRDLYPAIQDGLRQMRCGSAAVRVREVFDTLSEIYPTHSPLVNERCELVTYAHYTDRAKGTGAILERIYGPLFKFHPILRKMLKKGTWLSNHARYEEWYYGEDEPML